MKFYATKRVKRGDRHVFARLRELPFDDIAAMQAWLVDQGLATWVYDPGENMTFMPEWGNPYYASLVGTAQTVPIKDDER